MLGAPNSYDITVDSSSLEPQRRDQTGLVDHTSAFAALPKRLCPGGDRTWSGLSRERAIAELRIHAEGSRDASGPGLADVLWRSQQQDEEDLNLDAVWRDLAKLFQALLSEVPTWRTSGVPIAVSYAVAEIGSRASELGLCGPDSGTRRQGVLLAWRVAVAWDASMAGDIADVAEHVRGEEWALQLSEGDESDS